MTLKIHCRINKTRDVLPTLDSHSSAEVVKGFSALACKHSLTLQTELRWRTVFVADVWACVHTHGKPHTSPVCAGPCVRVAPHVALTTCCRFFFCLPLEPRADSHRRRSSKSEQREDGERHRPGLCISPLEWTTPTALPPALTCQAAHVGWSCWYVYGEGRGKRVSAVSDVFSRGGWTAKLYVTRGSRGPRPAPASHFG